MKRYIFTGVVVLVLVSSAACTSGSTGSDPEAVMEAYEAAWNAKDLQTVLNFYAKDAVEVNGRGVFVGKEEIEGVLSHAIEGFSADCSNYSLSRTHVTYDCILKIYANNLKVGENYEAVVRDGKIYANILTSQFNP